MDVASSLSVLALQRGYVKPEVVNGRQFSVTGGRHPVVDTLQPDSFVANDCHLDDKNVWIVTGPNMGGWNTILCSFVTCLVPPCPVVCCPVAPCPIVPCPALYHPAKSCQVLPSTTLPSLAVSCTLPPCPVVSCRVVIRFSNAISDQFAPEEGLGCQIDLLDHCPV